MEGIIERKIRSSERKHNIFSQSSPNYREDDRDPRIESSDDCGVGPYNSSGDMNYRFIDEKHLHGPTASDTIKNDGNYFIRGTEGDAMKIANEMEPRNEEIKIVGGVNHGGEGGGENGRGGMGGGTGRPATSPVDTAVEALSCRQRRVASRARLTLSAGEWW